MRPIFFIYTFLILPTCGWSQVKLEKLNEPLYFYTNLSIGYAPNRGSFTDLSITNQGDSRIYRPRPIDRRYPMWTLMLGAKYKRHAIELGCGQIGHQSGGEYVVESSPNKFMYGFSTIRTMSYVPLRYYHRVFNWGAKMSVELGAGLSWASFPDDGLDDFISESRERNYIDYYPDGKPFSIRELTDEEQMQRSALNYELNGRLNWQIGNRLGFNCRYNYIHSPKIIRKTDFSIIPQVGKTHTGTIYSNLTSSVVSLGVNYYISKPPPKIEKQNRENKDSIENKNRFYISSDLGAFYNVGNFKSSVNIGAVIQNDWPTATRSQLTLNVGWVRHKYGLELSYQKLNSFSDFTYNEWRATPESFTLKLMKSDAGVSTQYFAARFYRGFIHSSGNWRLNVGTGVALAKFSKSDASTDFQPNSETNQFLQLDSDPSVNLRIHYTDFEKIKEKTICLEANLKAERRLSKHWQVNFWTRYIYNPETIRSVKFNVNYNNRPNQFGEVHTSLSTSGVGTGLQFNF